MDIPPTTAAPAPTEKRRSADSLGREVRDSALLLGLSLGVTAGLTFVLQAALSVVD
jgi:hypothetical protein